MTESSNLTVGAEPLAPCPFCKNHEPHECFDGHLAWIQCAQCSTEGPIAEEDDEEATLAMARAKWNLASTGLGVNAEGQGVGPFVVDSYSLPEKSRFAEEIKVQRSRQLEGPDLWKVARLGNCLNRDGEWEYESMPSSRDDEFLARCRFASVKEAMEAAIKAAPASA